MKKMINKREKIKTEDLKLILANISSSMKKYLPLLIITLFLLVGAVVISVLAPNQLKKLTDIINQGAANKNINMNDVQKFALLLISM